MTSKKNLTLFEASSLITGYGIGGGVMAVPYLASMNGILPFIGLLAAAFFLSVTFHLMLAEIMLRDDTSNQMVEAFDKFVFQRRGGKIFTWIFFILILFGFVASLSAYIAEK